MAAAIREGRFDFDGLMKSLKDSPETIGKAAEATMSFSDKMTILKNKVELALEPLGKPMTETLNSFVPYLERGALALAKLGEQFGNLPKPVQLTIVGFGAFLAAIGPVLVMLGQMMLALPAIKLLMAPFVAIVGKVAFAFTAWASGAATLGEAIGFIVGPVGWVILAIGALITAGVLLYKNWDTVSAFLVNTWTAIKATAITVWEELVSFLSGVADAIVNLFTVTVPDGFNAFIKFFAELPGKVQVFLTDLFLEKIPYAVGYGIGWMIRAVSEGIPKLIQWFADLPGKIWFWLLETITRFIAWSVSMKLRAGEAGKGILDGIINFVKNLPQALLNLLVSAGQKLIDFLSSAKKSAQNIGKAIFDGVVGFVKSIPDKIADIFTGILDTIKGFVNKITGAISKITGSFKIGYEAGSSGSPPKLAKGTNFVPFDTMAFLHKKEAVIPADNNPANPSAKNPIGQTFSFEGMFAGAIFNVRSDNDIKLIAREIFNLQTARARADGVVYGT